LQCLAVKLRVEQPGAPGRALPGRHNGISTHHAPSTFTAVMVSGFPDE